MPPFHLTAAMQKRVFERVSDLRAWGRHTEEAMADVKATEGLLLRHQWELYLRREDLPGRKTRAAVLPCLTRWLDRRGGGLSFHLTQLLTGHGCFGAYLFKIGKSSAPYCEHCAGGIVDTIDHTWSGCPAWTEERNELCAKIGRNLALATITLAMVRSKDAWDAATRFAHVVMRAKERAERDRQAAPVAADRASPRRDGAPESSSEED